MVTVAMVRVRAKSALPRKETSLLAFALSVGGKSTNNTNLPNAGTLPSDVLNAATAYQTALKNVSTTKGVAQAHAAAKQNVVDAVNHLRDYVNTVAEKLPPDQAKAVIESAGFATKKHAVHAKPPLAIKFGGVAGTALAVALAAGHSAVYYFEYSVDQKTWVACPNVMECKTTVSGLAVGTTYYFRVRAQTRKGVGDYSAVVPYVAR